MGKACEAGREWKGIDVTEYCESLSLEACDIETGRGAVDLFCWGEVVMMGGRGGWLGFDVGETAGGDVAGDEEVADMIVVMFVKKLGERCRSRSRATSQRQSRPGQ